MNIIEGKIVLENEDIKTFQEQLNNVGICFGIFFGRLLSFNFYKISQLNNKK